MTLEALKLADIRPSEVAALAPIRYEFFMNTCAEVVVDQVRYNLARGLPELAANAPVRLGREGLVSICGAGPSLLRTTGEITGKVMAANAAIPALVKAGIRLDYAMIWDATPEMVRYVCDVEASLPGCEWMIASRVHPRVIDRLLKLDQRVTLWHTATTDKALADAYGPKRLQVFGGAQAVTRGVFLLGAMGFRHIHVFGADSSYSDETHVGGGIREETEMVCVVEGRAFRTTNWMIAQAESWVQFVMPQMQAGGVRITMHGDGLLPWAHQVWLRKTAKPTLRRRLTDYLSSGR